MIIESLSSVMNMALKAVDEENFEKAYSVLSDAIDGRQIFSDYEKAILFAHRSFVLGKLGEIQLAASDMSFAKYFGDDTLNDLYQKLGLANSFPQLINNNMAVNFVA